MPRRHKALHELAGTGDDGTTALLGGGRVSKTDLRIEAYGTVDEASSALGLAKALTADQRVREIAEGLQRDLYRLGAVLATSPHSGAEFASIGDQDVRGLDQLLRELEAEAPMPDGFVLPGQTPASGALDLARTVTRRAERRCLELLERDGEGDGAVLRYLNRLSLVLFALARFDEARADTRAAPAREVTA
ncbi:MAG: cob(I)yrinic acid a,c-diamide adenosyltransferase [Candidatus Dormibacteraeota bacterium]|nr:cob(I)yrinic acid a,c-diamide adenosyltransferase [Candidatus Dormibacteraeota bacterium]MBO0743592.1 cob(I)yrinic acid a,c-diamide adenosyltransferase [Candidatus Dormibacteraeota bacterium]